jgi:polysaccharide export outer membrane protein
VPTELNPVSLPEYVIEPPDVINIEAGVKEVEPDPEVDRLQKELRKPELAEAERQQLREQLRQRRANPTYTGKVRPLDYNPVANQFQVKPDGTVYLGAYGTVHVAGLTQNQARVAIRSVLAKQINFEEGGTIEDRILVLVDVVAYNSKKYYVITDGGGAGERMFQFPSTGKEFVSDAIAQIGGLPEEASKRNIWVARRTPQLNEEQILPVDWVGTSQWGVTNTNYQLFPGDRVYVKAQRIVTIDRTLGKLLNPVERLLGVTLLGTQTVNQINGRGFGFGGGGN